MTSASEDEDLKAAITLSLSQQQAQADLSTAQPISIAEPRTSTILNLKALHDERQARRAGDKREASVSPPPLSRKAPKLESSTVSLPSGAVLRSFSTTVQQEQQGRKPDVANAANNRLKQTAYTPGETPSEVPIPSSQASSSHLPYRKGTVKKTWAFGHPRDKNDIKLEEVLEPSTLHTAVISAFQWDTDWLLAKLKTPANGGSTKCVFIMEAKTAALKQQILEDTENARSWLKICFPPTEGGVFCMHSKLMLLFHERKLRIVVPTANLLNFDWGETGVMENSVFVVDLPRRDEAKKSNVDELTFFGKELLYFLEKQGVEQDVRDGILNFDFAMTEDVAFVHTVGGTSFGQDADRTGLLGLSRAVRHLGLEGGTDTQIDFITSSCGALRDEYLRNMHSAARGLDLTAQASAAASTAKASFFDKKPAKSKDKKEVDVRRQMRVYFPTHDTVRASTAGAVGTVCMERKYYEHDDFPKNVLRDYISKRPGLLSHNKILYARGTHVPSISKSSSSSSSNGVQQVSSSPVAWVYVGSANVSQSAWGNPPTYDKARKAWKAFCRNWECGVLLPVKRPGQQRIQTIKDDSETESENEEDSGKHVNGNGSFDSMGMEVFDQVLPMPCQYPGATYNGREPWYFKERV